MVARRASPARRRLLHRRRPGSARAGLAQRRQLPPREDLAPRARSSCSSRTTTPPSPATRTGWASSSTSLVHGRPVEPAHRRAHRVHGHLARRRLSPRVLRDPADQPRAPVAVVGGASTPLGRRGRAAWRSPRAASRLPSARRASDPPGLHRPGRGDRGAAVVAYGHDATAEDTRPPRDLVARASARGAAGLSPAEDRFAELVLADPRAVAGLTIPSSPGRPGRRRRPSCASADGSVYAATRSCGSPRRGVGPHPGEGGGHRDISARDTVQDVIAKVAYADTLAVEETRPAARRGLARRRRRRDRRRGRVDVYGIAASGIVAADLQQKLHRIASPPSPGSDPHLALTSATLLGPRRRRCGHLALGHDGRGPRRAEPPPPSVVRAPSP